jgi:hypothetical protein
MKTIILSTIIILLSSFTIVQPNSKTKPDPRLYEALSDNEISEMLSKNPFLIQYYNYFLDHSYKIIEQPKSANLNLPQVSISDIDSFNILLLKKKQKLKREWGIQTYYEIKGTNMVLVFISEKEFTQKLSKYLGKEDYAAKK